MSAGARRKALQNRAAKIRELLGQIALYEDYTPKDFAENAPWMQQNMLKETERILRRVDRHIADGTPLPSSNEA